MYAKQAGLDHSEFIKQLVYLTGCQNYLELGIYDGHTFSKVASIVNNAVAVDIKDVRINRNIGKFHLCTTDEFFKNNKQRFDIIFIDADHRYESVKKDFLQALQILNKHGIIILHDTDPSSKHFLQDGYCSDCYKIVEYLKDDYFPMKLDVVTLPISECGLTLVKLSNESRVKEFINE